MAVAFDNHPSFRDYADPGRLVSASWLSARLGVEGLHVIECNEDSVLYNIGHLPSALRINPEELVDPATLDVIDGEGFAALLSRLGISREDTVVFYGDRGNRWACFALWVFELFGHPDTRILDGGREGWMQEERDTSLTPALVMHPSNYPVCERNDAGVRAFVDELADDDALTAVDVRSAAEFSGLPHQQDAAEGELGSGPGAVTTRRQGHVPGAIHLPWKSLMTPAGMFRSRAELDQLWPAEDSVVYSQVGARAALVWFVGRFLLGHDKTRIYDGGWSEWGNMVGMPIDQGTGTS
ncbi:sulfurtransferase [Corynebacterium propinquum]